MPDRQDIDALLIGDLYGELDGDERARLEAHLASHPQDRSALDGLRSTREILREADLPATMATAEPSPAISALLLQEAARRAPAKAAGGGILAYLAGLLRPFAASPALSAAAALVLVGGAAGLLYSRGAFDASEPVVHGPSAAGSNQADRNEAEHANAPVPTVPGASIDDYRVGLADSTGGDGDEVGRLEGATATAAGEPAEEATGNARGSLDQPLDRGLERQATRSSARKGGAGAGSESVAFQAGGGGAGDALAGKLDNAEGRRGYIELDKASKDQPTVLALDGDRYAGDKRADDVPAGGAVAKKAPARAEPAPPPATTQKPSAAPSQVARDEGKAGGAAPAKAAALETWARDQHARMVKLVNAGKCVDAGTIGAEISRKAPDYYQANVANDRAVRACRSYVDRARRAKNEGAKSKAATPRSPQPDSPYEADMDSVR